VTPLLCIAACQRGAAAPPGPDHLGHQEENGWLSETQITAGTAGAYEVDLVPVEGGFALTWYDTRDHNAEIYFTLVDSRGKRLLPEVRVTHTSQQSYEPSMALSGKRYGVAWYEAPESDDHSSASQTVVRFAVLDMQGTILAESLASEHDDPERSPLVVAVEHGFIVIWLRRGPETRVMARRFTSDGIARGEAVDLGFASSRTWSISGQMFRGDLYIAFNARGKNSAEEVFLVRTDSGLQNPLEIQLTADDGAASVYPDVVFGPSSKMVCWQDERDGNSEVYVGRLDLGELKLDESRLTFSMGQTFGVHAAAIPGGFAIALDDDSSDNREVYLAMVGPSNQDGLLRVSRARFGSFVPAVAWNGEVLGIAWNDFRAASGPRDFERSDIFFAWLPLASATTEARPWPR
jgi:hypothetical protein